MVENIERIAIIERGKEIFFVVEIKGEA